MTERFSKAQINKLMLMGCAKTYAGGHVETPVIKTTCQRNFWLDLAASEDFGWEKTSRGTIMFLGSIRR
jgi:hypothetical protein